MGASRLRVLTRPYVTMITLVMALCGRWCGSGRLLTNSHRLHRHMTDNPTCPRCGKGEETILHAFCDCEDVTNVWLRFVHQSKWDVFFSLHLNKWLKWNSQNEAATQSSRNWKSTFGSICWHVWKQRNCMVFENERSNTEDIFFVAWYTISDIITASEREDASVFNPTGKAALFVMQQIHSLWVFASPLELVRSYGQSCKGYTPVWNSFGTMGLEKLMLKRTHRRPFAWFRTRWLSHPLVPSLYSRSRRRARKDGM
ncbi:ribonuclease H [Senna tora]|uniref:Ribonuclease H n=1 Tax=Senna tora TaxID=362788 RepID=A0A834WFJ1_9FABA|nr:ribonuclease H [Senna tora]